jgi:hypothetical protein
MTSLHQSFDQDNGHEGECAVERLQSRWSSRSRSSSRSIVDRPPSHPLTNPQMDGRPISASVLKESHQYKDIDTRNSRRGSPVGRLQRSNSKWGSGSVVINDSPPLQPLRFLGREILEPTVVLEPAVSVGTDLNRSQDLSNKSYGGIALTDDRCFYSYRTINDGERRGNTASCA